jgi:hypothetical protein
MGKPQFRSIASNLKYSFTSAGDDFVSIKTVLEYPKVEYSKKYIINFFRIAIEAKPEVVVKKSEEKSAPNNPIEIAILKLTPNASNVLEEAPKKIVENCAKKSSILLLSLCLSCPLLFHIRGRWES